MNYRKIVILPALFILSHIFYIGCCKCTEAKNHFYEVRNALESTLGSGGSVIDTGAVTHVDSVYLYYSFDSHCVASHSSFSFLANAAYACKCDECGGLGLKSVISSIEITSDSIYNGVPPNASLNSFFKVFISPSTATSADSLKDVINRNDLTLLYSLSVFTTTKPGNNNGHIIKLKILFTDGREITASTKTIFWI